MKRTSSTDHVDKARSLRRVMSPPEARLWQVLRTRPGGHKFRRQQPIEPYVLDFFCNTAALAVEVDGISHDMGDNPQHDERRDARLAKRGIKTPRFLASDILHQCDAVVAAIVEECASRSPSTACGGAPPREIAGRR